MPELVALDLPGGTAFVDELRRAWDRGDAVAPLDRRLPPTARDAQLAALRPTAIVDETGRRAAVGEPVKTGDALVVATSGTTGTPRAVVLTHDALETAARATSAALDVDPTTDRWLACLPLAHVGGLSVVTRALLTGTDVEVHDGFDAAAVDASSATLVSLVPAVLGRVDTTAFRRILLGGSAIPGDRPSNSVATYGMTETGGGVVYDGHALDGVDVRAVDGELQLRGPQLLRCYRDGTDPRIDDGWFPTGDAGTVDHTGTVRVTGRLAEVIVTGGEKVWPGPVERLLETHPGVAEAVVVGRDDPEWGMTVTAVVVAADPSSPPRLDDLRALVRESLPPWCAPRSLELRGALPRTSLGKIRRHDL